MSSEAEAQSLKKCTLILMSYLGAHLVVSCCAILKWGNKGNKAYRDRTDK